MATMTPPSSVFPGPDDDPAEPRLMRVPDQPAALRRSALAMLLTGRDVPHEPGVQHFMGFIQRQGLSLDGLWAAYEGKRPIAAALLLPGAGQTAMLFVSPVTGRGQIHLAQRLVRAVLADQDPGRTRLVQALLDPAQHLSMRTLQGIDFQRLARLIYMQRPLPGRDGLAPPPSLTDHGDRLVHWSEDQRDLFEQAILASYEDTRDCPGLLGLRSIHQIIASHMATGVFHPDLWTVCVDQAGRPRAVMLLCEVPAQQAYELVYLGVSKPDRSRGLATAMLRQGLWQTRQAGGDRMILAVDEANPPALGLYRRLGFRATTRKTAMIRKPVPGSDEP